MNDNSDATFRLGPARLMAAVAVGLTVLWGTNLLASDEPPEQVWLISTRQAPLSCTTADANTQEFGYWRLGADQQWISADCEAFVATDDPAVPTSVFIHGNRISCQAAFSTGMTTYRHIVKQAPGRPFRFVIWSWPADHIRGRNRQDVQVKACRSDVQSLYLAQCIDRMNPEVSVSMMGYSFGARVITGAMHILSGGRVAGREMAEPAAPRRAPLRAILVAAALDNHWLLPGHRNGLALSQLDRVLITRNCCDPVLKWYPLMYHRGGPQALGYIGPACTAQLGDEAQKLELLGVTCSVGKDHAWLSYLRAPGLQSRLADYSFLESPEPDAELAVSVGQ